MKKFIYMAIIAVVTALSVSSCTEEEVKPSMENGGGGANEEIKKG